MGDGSKKKRRNADVRCGCRLCVCVCERGREGERKWCSPCSSLSARRSRWLSRVEGTADPQGALGTPSALHRARSPPSQHSPNTQALAIKTTPNKHATNTPTTCGRVEGGAKQQRRCACCRCLVLLGHIYRQRWKDHLNLL